jgi:hypothetical protein
VSGDEWQVVPSLAGMVTYRMDEIMWIDAFLEYMKGDAGVICILSICIAFSVVIVGSMLFPPRK